MGTALKYYCDELYYNSKAINKLQKMLTTIKAEQIANIYVLTAYVILYNTRK